MKDAQTLSSAKKKILLVDDDESILDSVELVLEESGYKIETTPKGSETYQKVQNFKPDLILLDVLMSGVDGREICKTLKSDESTKQIPLIMISAHPSASKSSLKCGANDFLAKPFDTQDLLKIIQKHL